MAFKIVRNDITKMNTEAIVNTANDQPAVGTGCDHAVYRAAGYDELLRYRKEKIGIVPEGEVFITPGFHLQAKYIIHAVSPRYRGGHDGEEEKLRACYRKSLQLAKENKICSVAFPLISTGAFGYPKEEGMRIAVDEINAFLLNSEMDIFLVVFDDKSRNLGRRIDAELEEYIDQNYVENRSGEEYGEDLPGFASRYLDAGSRGTGVTLRDMEDLSLGTGASLRGSSVTSRDAGVLPRETDTALRDPSVTSRDANDLSRETGASLRGSSVTSRDAGGMATLRSHASSLVDSLFRKGHKESAFTGSSLSVTPDMAAGRFKKAGLKKEPDDYIAMPPQEPVADEDVAMASREAGRDDLIAMPPQEPVVDEDVAMASREAGRDDLIAMPPQEPVADDEIAMSMSSREPAADEDTADFLDFEEIHVSKLEERMKHTADTFSQYLMYLIHDKNMKNVDVYKRAIIDKKIFSKIKNHADYHPQKLTALCLCVGAKLNLDESKDLLARAGYALSPCDKTDIIFSYFIENEIYDMIELDIQLEEHGLPCIIS